jgi:hypothetical protein
MALDRTLLIPISDGRHDMIDYWHGLKIYRAGKLLLLYLLKGGFFFFIEQYECAFYVRWRSLGLIELHLLLRCCALMSYPLTSVKFCLIFAHCKYGFP